MAWFLVPISNNGRQYRLVVSAVDRNEAILKTYRLGDVSEPRKLNFKEL